MHVRSKAQRHSIAGGGSKIICREKQEPRSALLCGSASLLHQAERLQRWPIDSRSNREAIVGLERRQRSACLRSEEYLVPNAETIVSPMVYDAHVSVAIQRQIACEGQISPLMCAVAMFFIRPAVDAPPQTRRLLPL
jgi:hypothetical protein